MVLDLVRAANATKTVIGVADEATKSHGQPTIKPKSNFEQNAPSDEVLRYGVKLLVRGEVEVARPVDNLAIRLVRLVGTERGPANQALEHDGANGPPIAAVVVTPATEDLRGDVVGRADR